MKSTNALIQMLLTFAVQQKLCADGAAPKTKEGRALVASYSAKMTQLALFCGDLEKSRRHGVRLGFVIIGVALLAAAVAGFVLGILWTQGAFL